MSGSFWLGLETAHQLTSKGEYELRIDLLFKTDIFHDHYNIYYHAHYDIFRLAGESDHYKLEVSGYSGTAGDSLSYHNMMAFSTPDRDHDLSSIHCAHSSSSCWWYKSCYTSDLNGPWGSGLFWKDLCTSESAKLSEIKIRPKVCPSGWTDHDKKCYKFSESVKADPDLAMKDCQDAGGELAEATSQEVTEFMLKLSKHNLKEGIWLPYKKQPNGEWRHWQRLAEPLSWTNWGTDVRLYP